jgi:DNA-binding Lrp family transcriptional regulator
MANALPLGGFISPGDRKDAVILEQVQRNARLSFAELGRRAGLSPPAAAERLRRLEESGVVPGYHAEVAPAALGLELLVAHLSQFGDTSTSLVLSSVLEAA